MFKSQKDAVYENDDNHKQLKISEKAVKDSDTIKLISKMALTTKANDFSLMNLATILLLILRNKDLSIV